MSEPLRLLCVLAHPDDESLGLGGTLAKYALEGVETYLVTATRGERGRFGSGIKFPGFAGVGRMREAELLAAAKQLGLREVCFLDYLDGELDQAEPTEIIAKIVAELRRVRPHVVLTFGPEGGLRTSGPHRYLPVRDCRHRLCRRSVVSCCCSSRTPASSIEAVLHGLESCQVGSLSGRISRLEIQS